VKQRRTDCQRDTRHQEAAADHRPAPDRVEQAPEQQRTHEVADGEHQQVHADDRVRDLEELGQDRREREQEGVVGERLRAHEHEPEGRALRVARHEGLRDLAEADRLALVDAQRLALRLGQLPHVGLLANRLLDLGDDLLGFLRAAMREQPAWALG
jgi:hypothetical protein